MRRPRRRGKAAAFEALEPRAMLAITGLPTTGSQGGAPVVLVADTLDPSNQLDIVLDDTTNAGFVTATITVNGGTPATIWDFGDSITFTGTADSDGAIVNEVTVTTPYSANVWGLGVFGVLTSTNWNTLASFAPSTLPDVQISLFNADTLGVTAGILGDVNPVTIAGEFQSPTDLTVAGATGAEISLTSFLGIADDAGAPIQTYELTLMAASGPIAIDANVITRGDLTIESQNAPLILGTSAPIAINSTQGVITIANLVGPIMLNETAITANLGRIEVTTPNLLTATGNASFTAPLTYDPVTEAGLLLLEGQLGLSLPVAMPVAAGRLDLRSLATTPVTLTNTSVATLRADVGGDLTLTTALPLEITDFDPAVASVEISANSVTLQAEAGIRVVDGFDITGTLCLTTSDGLNTPTIPVEFVTTATSDNPAVGAPFTGTLRDMIEYVNANTILPLAATNGVTRQPMNLLFDESGSAVAIGGTIALQEALPGLAAGVTFDGTLPDGTLVAVDGGATVANGLTLGTRASRSVVRDAFFHGFANAGVRIESQGNLLSGLTLGVTRGDIPAPNKIGVELHGVRAVQNTIGIATIGVDVGNRIVANTFAGILIGAGANFNTITGNTIGDSRDGNFDGISVVNSLGTIIGGTQSALANTIRGNDRHGIRLVGVNGVAPAYGASIVGNDIIENAESGVTVEGGSRNVIGGGAAAAANDILRNGVGVRLVANGIETTRRNNVVGNTIADNETGGVLVDQGVATMIRGNTISDAISGTSQWGVRIFRTAVTLADGANRVVQNVVSGHGDATAADPALTGGIVVERASGQVIGGLGTFANRVVENRGSGIVIIGGPGFSGSSRNVVEGNYVGTDASGSDLGNAFDGIRIQGGLANTIRGNIVRFSDNPTNAGVGISVHNATPAAPILGNIIVSNEISESETGILISGSGGTVLGGAVPGQGNAIFGNTGSGVVVRASAANGASAGTIIRNNRIGVSTRTAPAGNGGFGIDLQSTVGTVVDQGNTVANNDDGGIRVQGGRSITLGSTTGAGNSVWGNLGNGIDILEPVGAGRTESVVVAGNDIRGNGGFGVNVFAASAAASRVSAITIGRPVPVNRPTAATNSIVGNLGGGVRVDAAQAVSIVGNSIASNDGPGIELLNGANGGVSAPTLTSAAPRVIGQKSPQFDVRGEIGRTGTGTEQQIYYVDIYGTNSTTSRQVFLGRVVVVIRAGRPSASFRAIVGAAGQRYDQIMATATLGVSTGTSDYSNTLRV